METKVVDAEALLKNSEVGHWVCCHDNSMQTYCGIIVEDVDGFADEGWESDCVVCHDINQVTPPEMCPVSRMICDLVYEALEKRGGER